MGFLSKIFKKVTRTVKKPLSKVFKGVARGIAKVGKAVMRGVNYVNKKLGPLGAIAMAIAMPYALSGLSAGTTGLMNSNSLFLRSIGNVGNSIRMGYQATTGAISNAFSSITNSIAKGFSQFAGKGTKIGNYWTKISKGAKNLYRSAQNNFAKTFGKKATSGSVDVFGLRTGPHVDGGIWTSMKTDQAASLLNQNLISGEQLRGQSLASKSGWWTQDLTTVQKANQKLISNTINEAWNQNNILSQNALRWKNDLVTQAKDMGSYINDEQIGNIMKNNGAKSYDLLNSVGGEGYYIDVDLTTTGDYKYNPSTMRPNPHLEGGASVQDASYTFNGNKSFNTQIAKDSKKSLSKKLKSYAFSKADSLLSSKMPEHDVVYEVDTGAQNLYADTNAAYGGTDIKGSAGGDLFAQVFGKSNANNISTYYKNMNILSG